MRCDTSLSWREFKKHLTGECDVAIDYNKITISHSGQVQPAEPPSKPPCVIANFGDELEDIGQKILAMSRNEQAELARYLGEVLCQKKPI